VVCAGGALGILIPPSIMLVVWGPTAGISVGALFLAAIPAGLLLSALYVIYTWLLCVFDPRQGPVWTGEPVSFGRRLWDLLVSVVPVALLVLAVLGTIFFGLAAPTEAAALGASGSLLLALAYRRLDLHGLLAACYTTVRISAMVYMVLIGAGFLSAMFIRLQGAQLVTDLVLGMELAPALVLVVMLAIVFVLGMFIDWIGIIMITVPIFMPIAQNLGYDPLWFSMLVIVTMQTSFLTPPFAYTIFYLKGIAPPEVTTLDIYRGVVPFLVLQVIAVALIALFPELILFLPHSFGLTG
jgi:tripartite ATP-independent transporter DctM subunit